MMSLIYLKPFGLLVYIQIFQRFKSPSKQDRLHWPNAGFMLGQRRRCWTNVYVLSSIAIQGRPQLSDIQEVKFRKIWGFRGTPQNVLKICISRGEGVKTLLTPPPPPLCGHPCTSPVYWVMLTWVSMVTGLGS